LGPMQTQVQVGSWVWVCAHARGVVSCRNASARHATQHRDKKVLRVRVLEGGGEGGRECTRSPGGGGPACGGVVCQAPACDSGCWLRACRGVRRWAVESATLSFPVSSFHASLHRYALPCVSTVLFRG
jgi:hypothetical protein